MSEETTQNFLAVMQSFEWPDPVPVTYRLYHDEQGRPLIYTMEALSGAYIEVDQDTYIRASHHVRVVDGKLMILPQIARVIKLRPHAEHGATCDPRDVCVIVTDDQPNQRWSMSADDQD
jgi:hypothetical protein